MSTATFVLLEPEELFFRDVRLSQGYTQTVRITNTLRGPIELTVKPGSSERYTVLPASLRLRAEETASVEVRLKVVRFAQRQKAVEQGHRDIFHIKGSHFDQKFYATFWLAPDVEQPPRAKPGPGPSTTNPPPRVRAHEAAGPGPNMSPPSSPTRARKPITKSVSFAEPGSPHPSNQTGPAAGSFSLDGAGHRVAQGGAANRSGDGDGSTGGDLHSLRSPPRPRSGLRQALASLQSPRRSASFLAMETGARHVQEDALDRAKMGGAVPPPATSQPAIAAARRGGALAAATPPWGVSTSIDFGQLAADARGGEATGGSGMAAAGAGSPSLSPSHMRGPAGPVLGIPPPRAPSRSLPSSPTAVRDTAAVGTAAGSGAQFLQRAASTASSSSGGDDSHTHPYILPSDRRSHFASSAPIVPPLRLPGSAAAAPTGYDSSPRGPGALQLQPRYASAVAASHRLPPKQQEQQYWLSPGRSRSGPSEDGGSLGQTLSPSNRSPGAKQTDGRVPGRYLPPSGSIDSSSSGSSFSNPRVLISQLQRPRHTEREDSGWRMEQADAEGRQFLEDEARTVGLHLARSSIESLAAEAERLRAGPASSPFQQRAAQPVRGPPAGMESPKARGGWDGRPERGRSREASPRPLAASPSGRSRAEGEPGDSWRAAPLPQRRSDDGRGGRAGSTTVGLDRGGAPIETGAEQRGAATSTGRQPASSGGAVSEDESLGAADWTHDAGVELQLRLQSLARQQASMRRTLEQQQEVLKDKNSMLQALQGQLQATQAELKAQSAARSASPAAKLAQEREVLASERDGLAARLADAEAELETSRAEAAALRRLQLELQSRQPDVTRAVEAAVEREQALQEERNRKALELLMSKDDRVRELEDQVEELRRQNEGLRARLVEVQERAQAAEAQVLRVVQQKETLVEAAQRDREQADSVIESLESRLAARDRRHVELSAAQERAAAAEARVALVEQTLAAAEQRALEADARARGLEAARQQVLRHHEEHKDTTFVQAEELRSECTRLQQQHAEAMRQQTETHRQQVSELQSTISDLAQELARTRTGPASGASKRESSGDRMELETAKSKLEAEVQALRAQLAGSAHSFRERAWEQVELDRLRMLVSERDAEVAELASHLEILRARSGAGRGGSKAVAAAGSLSAPSSPRRPERASEAALSPLRGRQQQQRQSGGRGRSRSLERETGEDKGQGAVVEALRRQLVKSEAALRAAQERLVLVEARAAVAQKTAGKGEEELEAAQRSMVGSVLEHQRLQQELDSARAATVRLNGRISDLVQAEQVARAELDAAKAKLGQLQELHTSEIEACQDRLQRLAEHIAATQPEVLQVLLGPDYVSVLSLPASPGGLGTRAAAETGAQHRGGAATGAAHSGFGGPSQQLWGGSVAAPLSRERELEKAVDTAETAVAVMQERLLAALKAAADAGEEAMRVRREAEWEQARVEAELRAAREEGSLRVRNLEEAVARLGARGGDAAQAMARSLAEADAAARRECRLRSELALAQQAAQRANAQTAELRLQLRECEQALREARVYGGLLAQPGDTSAANAGAPGAPGAGARAATANPGLGQLVEERLEQQALELFRRQQVIARLVDVAERAQAEAVDLQSELNALKQTMPDPKQHIHHQYAELQRRLGATEAELRACRDAKSSCELELARSQQQLAEKAREVDKVSERLAACERDIAAKEEAAARKAVEVRGAMAKEVAVLSRRVAEAQRAADEAEARARELDTQLNNLRAELTEARAQLEAQAAAARQLRLKGREEKRAAEEAARQSKRAAEMSRQEAQERRSQLAIMMETIEVLQAGNPGEREQRIVSLTAQLSALTSRESLAEQRAQGLLADAEGSVAAAQQLQSEVSELNQQIARLEQQLAAAASNRMMLEGELAAVRSDVRTRDAASLRTARELDEREQRVASLEGEVEALRRALNDTQSRHADQLAREREEVAAATRQARAESCAAAAASSQAARLERFQASLDELLMFIESRSQQQQQHPPVVAAGASADPDAPAEDVASAASAAAAARADAAGSPASWVVSALHRFKGLALESEREYLTAATDARLYRIESRWAWSRLHRLQWALEQRTGEWHVAQARVQQLERAMARRSEEAAMHALEQVALQDKQVAALDERLQAMTGKLVVATSQAAGAEAALAAARASAAALQRQVVVSAAERKELNARLAAAEMQAAGSTEALNLGAEAALAQRDLSIRQYFDAQVATLVAKPDVRDKVMALAREVCALKLSESQLLASLAAAKHRGDASSQLASQLQAALRGAEEMLEQSVSQQTHAAGGTDHGAAAGGGAAASGLGVEVARLSAQLVAQSHEIFRLQETALRSKQAYERRESDIEELQAQLAAAELLLTQARAEGSAALFALREQLTEVHDQDRQLLIREIREMQERLATTRDLASKDVELAQQHIAEVTAAKDAEMERRLAAAMAGQVEAARLHEAEARATCSESRAAHLESQVEALQEALTAAQAQVKELEDLRDVTGAAVASLEATLARIEKTTAPAVTASGTGSSSGGGGGGGSRGGGALTGGARRLPPTGSSGSHAAASTLPAQAAGTEQAAHGLAGLSREIVRAKMAEAEAVRRMRASARSEVDMQQKLLQRDERISELKEQLAAKTKALEELRRRTSFGDPPGRSAAQAGGAAASAPVTKQGYRSRSPSPSRGPAGPLSVRPGASTAVPRRLSAEAQAPSSESHQSPEAADAEYLAEQVAQLRIEVARRQAEIERLQGAMAEANTTAARGEGQRPPVGPGKPGGGQAGGTTSVDRIKDQLASANAEITLALSAANSMLLRLQHQGVPISGPVGGAEIARRAGSPARRSVSTPGATLSDAPLAPGTLSGVMQQLASALQAMRTGRPGATLPTGRKSAEASVKDATTLSGAAAPSSSSGALEAASGDTCPDTPADELRRLHEDYRVLLQQREDVAFRCAHLEGELDRCRELMRKLQASAVGRDDVGRPQEDQASKLWSASQLSRILEGSISALHALCDRMQTQFAALSQQQAAPPDDVQQMLARVVSELVTMDTTVGMLKTELGNVAAQASKPPGRTDPATATSTPTTSVTSYGPSDGAAVRLSGPAGPASIQSVAAHLPSSSGAQGAAALLATPTPSTERSVPAWLSWESSASGSIPMPVPIPNPTNGAEQQRRCVLEVHAAAALESTGTSTDVTVVREGAGVVGDVGVGCGAGDDPSADLRGLDHHPSSSSVGSRQSGQAAAAVAAGSVRQSGSVPEAKMPPTSEGSAQPPAVTHAQAVALATTAAKHKARADKWKQRSKELGAQLSLLNASAAAREAAASERHVVSVQHLEQELRTWRAEASRLAAELSGVEAARRELEAVHPCGGGQEAQALVARAAEEAARATALQQQLDAERAKAAAELASHLEEVATLKAAVAQEKGERARLLVSLRESHNSAQQAGDVDAPYRTESLQAHASAAAARAAAERAEERAAAWRAESDSLRQRLQQSERGRLNLIASLEGRLAAAERRAAECGQRAAERVEELTARLAEAQAAAKAAPAAVEAKLRELEPILVSMQAHTEAMRRSALSEVQVGRWNALTRIVRYQAVIKQLQADTEARRSEWERERAQLQATTGAAMRRSEAIAADLDDLRTQMVELQAAVDADRQQLTARHAAQIQDLQQQIDQERRRFAEQAIARAEAAVAASERAAEESASSRLQALEGDYSRRLSQLEAARQELLRELQSVQEQFSQYQAQKAAEVATLERRIRTYIDTHGSGHSLLLPRHTDSDGADSPQPRARARAAAAAALSDGGAGQAPPGARRNGSALPPPLHRSLRRAGSLSVAARRRTRLDPSQASTRAAAAAASEAASARHPQAAAAPTQATRSEPDLIGAGAAAHAGQQQLAPSQLMALARASEALAAAQREAAFERALRGRVEAQAGLLRGAMARLRAKLRAVTEQLDGVRARAVSTDEHRQLQAELAACREQLKAARADSARRQKALQALQSMAMAQPSSSVQSVDGPMGLPPGLPTAAGALRAARANRFATAPAAGPTGHSLRPSLAGSMASHGGLAAGGFSSAGGLGSFFPDLIPEENANGARPGPASGVEDDPLAAALEAAAANARAAASALEGERAARQALEARLREAKANVDRKAALVRDLRRRVEELEVLTQKQTVAANEEAGAEARARGLAAALTRKDAVIKELRERLEAAQTSLAAGSAAAEAGGEELEAARRAGTRLRADLAKREAALRVALADLDKEREQRSEAAKQLEAAHGREAATRRQAAATLAALHRRAGELLEALRDVCRVLLQSVAAMDAAADHLQQQHHPHLHPHQHPHQARTSTRLPGATSVPAPAEGAASAGLLSAQDISQLTSLSVEDVRHLLGPDAGDLACMLGLQHQQHRRQQVAASVEAAQRVGELLSALEAAMEAAAVVMAPADGVEGEDTLRDVDEVQTEADQLRDQLLAAVADAADPAAAAAAVLNSRRGVRSAVMLSSTGTAGEGVGRAVITCRNNAAALQQKPVGPGRRASGASRGGVSAAVGGAGDSWDGRTLQVLVEEVQSEAQRAESELAAALRGAGAL